METISYLRADRGRRRRPPPSSAAARSSAAEATERVDWVDIAKGICIVLVVTMHATLGVEAALGREGFMHWVVAYSKPFRLPDFFLVSGLFLARVIDRDWRSYADKRVLQFVYFYVLWLLIQSAVKFSQLAEGSAMGFLQHLAISLVEPFSTLWFVYALAIFSVVTKLLRPLPPMLVLAAAALLQILPIETSWAFLNEVCERWVYFLAGYMFAPHVFRLADWARQHGRTAAIGLAAWALANGALALTPTQALGALTLAELPGIGLIAGGAGAIAITIIAALLVGSRLGGALRYVGSKSLAVYLTFFLPMAFMRLLLLRVWPLGDAGVIALLVTLTAMLFPLVCEWLVRGTRFGFLYVRPAWAHLAPRAPRPEAEPEVLVAEPVPASGGIDLSRAFRGQPARLAWQPEHSPSTSTALEPGLNPAAAAVPRTPRATSSEVTSSTLPHVVQTRKTVVA